MRLQPPEFLHTLVYVGEQPLVPLGRQTLLLGPSSSIVVKTGTSPVNTESHSPVLQNPVFPCPPSQHQAFRSTRLLGSRCCYHRGHSPPEGTVPGRGPSYWEASAGKLLPSLSQTSSLLLPMELPHRKAPPASTQPGVLAHPILLSVSSTWLAGCGSQLLI